jgi:hypothetical protein
MSKLKYTLSEQAEHLCSDCGRYEAALQLHTVEFTRNLLERYNPKYFVVLCPECHERSHAS